MDTAIRILIADDHPIVREGLKALLSTDPDLELVGEAGSAQEAVLKSRLLQPDVLLLDIIMPDEDGIAVIQQITALSPAVRILIVTGFDEDSFIFPSIQAGAQGYILKTASPQDLLQAIRNVHRGDFSFHPTIARRLIYELRHERPSSIAPGDGLTQREAEILGFVAQGFSNKQIAAVLQISERTVRTHVSSILDKLHLTNRTQATLYALKNGLATLENHSA